MNRFFIVFILSLIGFSGFGQQSLRRVASFPADLNEISGIQFIQHSFWAINDGGNPARLYQIDTFGNIVKTFKIPASNTDWEDICSDGDSMLYIGDFGNNDNNRKDLAIYAVNINQPQKDTLFPTKGDGGFDYVPNPIKGIQTLPSRIGSAFVGADGRPVEIDLGDSPFKRGGKVKRKLKVKRKPKDGRMKKAKGRDGIAQRGKTRGRMR